ncbi:MAG: hypothetical protein JO057_01980, partial [Chloroflexi bacterium]|nr:hypothetical protein [Chloroflexota bacterium]
MSIARRWTLTALVVGVLGLVATLALGYDNAENFFRAYLFGYTFWVGLALGSIGVLLTQFLTGGKWGLATRRVFEAGTATLPLMAVLFVPILFGLPYLYAWARPDAVAADAVLQHKAVYLNVPFFIIRSAVYLVTWVVLGYLIRRWSLAQDRGDDPLILRRLQRLSVVAAIILGFTVTFAAIDWLMSLDADWYSTMYPPMVAMGDMLLALALGTAFLALFGARTSLDRMLTPELFNDLGSLLLAFIM